MLLFTASISYDASLFKVSSHRRSLVRLAVLVQDISSLLDYSSRCPSDPLVKKGSDNDQFTVLNEIKPEIKSP